MATLNKFRLVNIEGLRGLVMEYGDGKRGDGFYSWDDIGDNEAAYLFSIGSHYVEKIEAGLEAAEPAPTTQKRRKTPPKDQL